MMRDLAFFLAGAVISPLLIVGAIAAWAIPRIRKDIQW